MRTRYFNIEVNGCTTAYDSALIYNAFNTSDGVMNILSCEFRIRDRTKKSFYNSYGGIIKNAYQNRNIQSNILDNIFFIDNLSGVDRSYYLYVLQQSNITLATNNFVASFQDASTVKTSIGVYLGGNLTASTFYDNQKIAISKSFGECIGLTTENCKNPEKLIEAGYVFATES